MYFVVAILMDAYSIRSLEPIMIVFLAVVVGTIVIALFLPLISIIQGLQQQT